MALKVRKLEPIQGAISVRQPAQNVAGLLAVGGARPTRPAPQPFNFFNPVSRGGANIFADAGDFLQHNVIKPTADFGVKAANTIGAGGLGIGLAVDTLGHALTGEDVSKNPQLQARARQIQDMANRSFVSPAIQQGKASPLEFGREFTKTGIEGATFAMPALRVAKGAPLAQRLAANAGLNAGVSGGLNTAQQLATTGNVNPSEVAQQALLGGVLGTAGARGRANVRTPVVTTRPEVSPPLARKIDVRYIDTSKPAVKLKSEAKKIAVRDGVPSRVELEPPVMNRIPDATDIDFADPYNNRNGLVSAKNAFGRNFVDRYYEPLALMRRIDKENAAIAKATGEPQRKYFGGSAEDMLYYDTHKIQRSNVEANKFIEESPGLRVAMEGLNARDRRGLSNYLIARRESSAAYEGKKTQFTPEQRQAIITAGADKFEHRFQGLNQMFKEILDNKFIRDSGILSPQEIARYKANNDYIHLERKFDDLARDGRGLPSERIGLSESLARKKVKGSAREAYDPIQGAFKFVQERYKEAAKNTGARNFVDTLAEKGLATRLTQKQAVHRNVITLYRNGKKEFWEVPRDVKKTIDGMEPLMMPLISRIIGYPTRILKLGTTALDPVFAASNLARDITGSAIQSKNARVTHNPINVVASMGHAVREFSGGSNDEVWKKFAREVGDNTRYSDLQKPLSTRQLERELRLGKKGVMINRAIHPIDTIEKAIGITENSVRGQNFSAIYKKVLKETGSEEAATRQATLAALRNSTDFGRKGAAGEVLNLLIPFFNPALQGVRSMGHAFRNRPVATSMKIVSLVTLPQVAASLYNNSTPEKKEAYNSIDDYEKRNNWIIVLDGAKQDKTGNWTGILKLPKPPGYRELSNSLSEPIDKALQGKDPIDASKMLGDLVAAVSGPISLESPEKFVGSVTPQALKPVTNQVNNRDAYTGRDIVPEWMSSQESDPSKQRYENTSGTAGLIAKQLGVSPLRVEKVIKDTFGGVGQYGIHYADQVAASMGLIDPKSIGGRGFDEAIGRRFMEATGETLERNKTEGQKYFEARERVTKNLNQNEKAAYDSLHPQKRTFSGSPLNDPDSVYNTAARLDIYNRYPKVFEADKRLNDEQAKKGGPNNPLYALSTAQLKKVLEKENLPPGATDPELSKLYSQDWYVDYKNKKSQYYDQIAQRAAKEGKMLGDSSNPYPETPSSVQKAMDYYSNLPKGTGARSSWIKANGATWAAMTDQWAKVDAWQNKARAKRGLAATEGDEGVAGGFKTASSSGSSYGGSRGGGGRSINPNIRVKGVANAKIKQASTGAKPVQLRSVKTSGGKKPKVTFKKARA